jgi:hypothetical protein
MPLPTFNRSYARWRSLSHFVDIIADAYETASDEMVNVHFGGHPEDFSEYLATNPPLPPIPGPEHMRELIDLIASTSNHDFVLSYEDRDFLGRVRSYLCDALTACLAGDVEAVATHADEAYKQLEFITYGRKRTDRRDFHNPFAVERERFEKLTARANRLARSLDRKSVSA